MNNHSFAFITPSYAPDFQRCKLLCWSIKQFIYSPIKHYIIVDKDDLNLFQQLADSNTIILSKEEVLPSWIKRAPLVNFSNKNIWLNLRGYRSGNWFLRGWLIQQIVKLAAAQYVKEDVLVFIDSDVAFIDYFNTSAFADGGKVRLFRVDHSTDIDGEIGIKWRETAKELLGLPTETTCYDFYVSQVVTWRRNNLIKLYRHIEEIYGRDWLEIISEVKDLSEYVLYGIFSSYVLGENSGHYDDHLQKICWCHWETSPMSDQKLRTFFQEARSSGHKAVMISAKSSMNLSIDQFQNYLALTQPYNLQGVSNYSGFWPDEVPA